MTSWDEILRVVVAGVSAYAAVVVILRLSGKRTLARMNAFDFVVTVALGSTLATTILSADTPWLEGAVAVGVLVLLQAIVSWLSVRLKFVKHAVRSRPTVLVRDGQMLEKALRRQRVAEGEVLKAIRSENIGDLSMVGAVVLESDGTFSVIPSSKLGDRSTLEDISS